MSRSTPATATTSPYSLRTPSSRTAGARRRLRGSRLAGCAGRQSRAPRRCTARRDGPGAGPDAGWRGSVARRSGPCQAIPPRTDVRLAWRIQSARVTRRWPRHRWPTTAGKRPSRCAPLIVIVRLLRGRGHARAHRRAAVGRSRRHRSRIDQPGTPEAPRPVTVIMRDYLFDPTPLVLVPGETIRLTVFNAGMMAHELVLGDAAVQQAWRAADAAATPPGAVRDGTARERPAGHRRAAGAARVGQAARSSSTRCRPSGELLLLCNLPGHIERGMIGQVELRRIGASASVGTCRGAVRCARRRPRLSAANMRADQSLPDDHRGTIPRYANDLRHRRAVYRCAWISHACRSVPWTASTSTRAPTGCCSSIPMSASTAAPASPSAPSTRSIPRTPARRVGRLTVRSTPLVQGQGLGPRRRRRVEAGLTAARSNSATAGDRGLPTPAVPMPGRLSALVCGPRP